MQKLKFSLKLLDRMAGKAAVIFVWLYQLLLSPDHSPLWKTRHPFGYCAFYPSCSQYCKESLKSDGLVIGSFKSSIRVLKCYPGRMPTINLSSHK